MKAYARLANALVLRCKKSYAHPTLRLLTCVRPAEAPRRSPSAAIVDE